MFGPVILLAAAISSEAGPALPAAAGAPAFRPTSGATALATASVRIVSGVRFGRDHSMAEPPEAIRRPVSLTERNGRIVPAELLEFQ